MFTYMVEFSSHASLIGKFLSMYCGGPFCNYRLGCLLPRHDPMVLGRRVRIGLTAIHPKPACAQTKAPLLKFWSHAYGNSYVGRCNITTKKGNMPTVSQKIGNTE